MVMQTAQTKTGEKVTYAVPEHKNRERESLIDRRRRSSTPGGRLTLPQVTPWSEQWQEQDTWVDNSNNAQPRRYTVAGSSRDDRASSTPAATHVSNIIVTLGVRHNRADIQSLGVPAMIAPHQHQPLLTNAGREAQPRRYTVAGSFRDDRASSTPAATHVSNIIVTLGVRHNRADIQSLGVPAMIAPHQHQPLLTNAGREAQPRRYTVAGSSRDDRASSTPAATHVSNIIVTLGVRHNRADIQSLGVPAMIAPHQHQPLLTNAGREAQPRRYTVAGSSRDDRASSTPAATHVSNIIVTLGVRHNRADIQSLGVPAMIAPHQPQPLLTNAGREAQPRRYSVAGSSRDDRASSTPAATHVSNIIVTLGVRHNRADIQSLGVPAMIAPHQHQPLLTHNRADIQSLGVPAMIAPHQHQPLLTRLIHNSPAARCGLLHVGDTIIAINRTPIRNVPHPEVVALIKHSGTSVTLTVLPAAPTAAD
ncbi:Membrane-associated guanylate kinase, WW and PDZ domain-containing protein 2 [Operophtera brumata]|uniref:Membrane-associated guanylate kinase, WW and PDZ domain-containing protein 2 n=1 Tax=Operophtera brumata TaxID=104452 RepID=A0A0L7LRV6_OPEBR|nr:Membrane-associated guanylate kinase, WW and PDZ domain-containing protein 2 [Operophtera brumata]